MDNDNHGAGRGDDDSDLGMPSGATPGLAPDGNPAVGSQDDLLPAFSGGRDEPASSERLARGDEEVSLPWLESSDDAGTADGSDAGRLLGFVLFGLLALGVIVGGIWWGTHRSSDPALVADGSTIPAPAVPYKTAPKNPGGKTFDGTGDSSFAVSEGQTRPARLGQSGPVAKSSTPAKAGASGPATGATPAVVPSGVGVQVAAYSTSATAEAGWTRLSQQYEALSGLNHRVVEGKADIGTVYRLQAVSPDAASANALCSRLRGVGLPCQVKN